MRLFHKPVDEKRMVVILPPATYQSWLDPAKRIVDFMVPFPADRLQATGPEVPHGLIG